MSQSSENRVYLDTSVLTAWLIILEKPRKVKLPAAALKCEQLRDFIVDDRLNCKFQTSEWALSEMIQTLRDRAILRQFLLDGYEISTFNRLKSKYSISENERDVIYDAIKNFDKFLHDLEVELVDLKLERSKIHEYCLRYSLETPDAIHLLGAIQNSDYLVTVDKPFVSSRIKEVQVIDPGTLISKPEVRK